LNLYISVRATKTKWGLGECSGQNRILPREADGSVFFPEPFKVLGYEFIPPRLRIPAEVALVLGLALPLLIPLVSDRLKRLLES